MYMACVMYTHDINISDISYYVIYFIYVDNIVVS
jgi:hypothetical protein